MFRSTCLIGALVILPVAASAQQPCITDARRVVAEVYQRVLERPFDTRGENLVTQLSGGQTTVREIVRAVAKLPEHQQRFLTGNREAAVTYLYKHLLGRDPDPVGLRDHVNGAAGSQGMGGVIDEIIGSGEYAQKFGDFGVPGSTVRYCGPGGAEVSSNRGNGNQNRMRFQGMDTNNNGIIERSEWNGSREAFVVEDWNGDNVLSGEEVQPGAGRAGRARGRGERGTAGATFNSWNAATFTNLDRNRDGRLAAAEWYYDTQSFVQADRNGDGTLTRAEFLNAGDGNSAPAAPVAPTENEFTALDTNRNGRVERNEWRSSDDAFGWLDRNKDGVLSRAEVLGNRAAADRFASLDANDDGRVSLDEWDGSRRSFSQQDVNGDGVLTRREFTTGEAVPTTGR